MIRLDQIRIDGGTQSRVELNQDVVAEYAEAYRDGAQFPPIVVFYDGSSYWLADGFHRYFGAKAAGKETIYEDVQPGTQREAVLYSLGANAKHGLRRSNADKRRAVETMLADAEWAAWPEAEIARRCGVSRPLVHTLISERSHAEMQVTPPPSAPDEAREKFDQIKAQGGEPRLYKDKHGNVSAMDVSRIGKKAERIKAAPTEPETPEPPATPQEAPAAIPAGMVLIEADRLAELEANLKELIADNESMARAFEAGDQVAAALDEAKRFREQNRILEERIRGLMNEKNEAIRAAKSWKRKAEKLEEASCNPAS